MKKIFLFKMDKIKFKYGIRIDRYMFFKVGASSRELAERKLRKLLKKLQVKAYTTQLYGTEHLER